MNTLYLIAGHHHNDPGAVSNHASLGGRVKEADLTIELRGLIKMYFELYNDNPVVIDNDSHVLSRVISEIASTIKRDDIMVDIHFNAFNGRATGVEVIVPRISSAKERNLADNICINLADIMKIPNRGVKGEDKTARGRIGILAGTGNRILIEVCFKDNPVDMLAYQKNKHLVADSIAQSIEKYINEK
jgi:N-acetylmuramoyl-L-alanine amidase